MWTAPASDFKGSIYNRVPALSACSVFNALKLIIIWENKNSLRGGRRIERLRTQVTVILDGSSLPFIPLLPVNPVAMAIGL